MNLRSMRLILAVSNLTLVLSLESCKTVGNRLDETSLLCGNEVKNSKKFNVAIFDSLNRPLVSSIDSGLFAEVTLKNGETQIVNKITSRGCIGVSAEFNSLRVISPNLGEIGFVEGHALKAKIRLSKVEPEVLSVRCSSELIFANSVASNPFKIKFASERYLSNIQVYAQNIQNGLRTTLMEINAGERTGDWPESLKLKNLTEGLYQLRLVQSNPFSSHKTFLNGPSEFCQLAVLRTKPTIEGLPSSPDLEIFQSGQLLPLTASQPNSSLYSCEEDITPDSEKCVASKKCQNPDNFHESTGIRFPSAGFYQIHYFAEDKAGNKGDMSCRRIAVFDRNPDLEISWKDKGLDHEFPVLQYLPTSLSASMRFIFPNQSFKIEDKKILCKATLLTSDFRKDVSSKLRCESGTCQGSALDQWQACDRSLSISLENKNEDDFEGRGRLTLNVKFEGIDKSVVERSSSLFFNHSGKFLRKIRTNAAGSMKVHSTVYAREKGFVSDEGQIYDQNGSEFFLKSTAVPGAAEANSSRKILVDLAGKNIYLYLFDSKTGHKFYQASDEGWKHYFQTSAQDNEESFGSKICNWLRIDSDGHIWCYSGPRLTHYNLSKTVQLSSIPVPPHQSAYSKCPEFYSELPTIAQSPEGGYFLICSGKYFQVQKKSTGFPPFSSREISSEDVPDSLDFAYPQPNSKRHAIVHTGGYRVAYNSSLENSSLPEYILYKSNFPVLSVATGRIESLLRDTPYEESFYAGSSEFEFEGSQYLQIEDYLRQELLKLKRKSISGDFVVPFRDQLPTTELRPPHNAPTPIGYIFEKNRNGDILASSEMVSRDVFWLLTRGSTKWEKHVFRDGPLGDFHLTSDQNFVRFSKTELFTIGTLGAKRWELPEAKVVEKLFESDEKYFLVLENGQVADVCKSCGDLTFKISGFLPDVSEKFEIISNDRLDSFVYKADNGSFYYYEFADAFTYRLKESSTSYRCVTKFKNKVYAIVDRGLVVEYLGITDILKSDLAQFDGCFVFDHHGRIWTGNSNVFTQFQFY